MPPLKNVKHETIAQRLTLGESQVNIEKELGFSPNYIAKLLTRNVHIKDRMSEIKGRMAQKVEFSQVKVLERLAELVDLQASDFDKPREEWTPAMQRWAFDEQPIMVRSQDGKTDDKRGGWDVVGTKVRLRASDKLKALELLGKLKSVDAFVANTQKIDINVTLEAERVRAELSSARDRRQARLASQVIETQVEQLESGEIVHVEEEPFTT